MSKFREQRNEIMKKHTIWMTLTNIIDIVQDAQTRHQRLPYSQRQPIKLGATTQWLAQMQTIRNKHL